ncbi:helix-turn-helix domain-containing protein [Nocardia panacis]|uniref:helix-turn-helix domain-containing protein n=1 Tax=Nocardia panacis TaxID=2340916 RepID=UPI0034E1FBE0
MLDALTRLREIADQDISTINSCPSIIPEWMNEPDACKLVNRSRWTLRDWRLAGLLKAKRRAGVWMYRRDELRAVRRALMENRRRGVKRPRHRRTAPSSGQLSLDA